jgi:hypothetical protein
MILIKQRVVDGSMLRLIKQSLTVEIAYEGKVEPTTVGVPQGSPISPLYSNIYLNLLDQVWHRRGYPEKLGATLHRYADDGILVCRKDATQALQAFEGIALRMGLTINREKTRITKLTEGFDFIGFQFVKRRSPNSGKLSIYIHPSKSSQCRTTDQKLHPAAGSNQARGVCPRGESDGAGMGELLSPHQCQRRFPPLAAIHQPSLSPLSELSQ